MIGRRVSAIAALGVSVVLLGACGGSTTTEKPDATAADSTSSSATSTTVPAAVAGDPALLLLLDGAKPLQRFSLGTDRLGVWVCHVPVGTTDPIYNPVDFRLSLNVETVTAQLAKHVTPYFDTLSNGNYHPEFVAGGEVSIAVNESNRDCVNKAQKQSGPDIDGLVVIADAEHAENQHGGWGRPGEPCKVDAACPASVSGRAAYIGASDFHPDWGSTPAVDLLEHEIGHTLGFPHSGGGDGYTSAIDVMSNSAAPRDVDGSRRNGPGTIAVNRIAAGWMPLSALRVVVEPGSYGLVASSAASGQRILVLPLDHYHFLTVEALDNTGFDKHLPHPGVVVHEIDQTPTTCRSGGAAEPCLNEYRTQFPVSGTAPFVDLLGDGATWSAQGWSVAVAARGGENWTITVGRTD